MSERASSGERRMRKIIAATTFCAITVIALICSEVSGQNIPYASKKANYLGKMSANIGVMVSVASFCIQSSKQQIP